MDLNLAFSNGTMSGDGNDDVGRFLIKGRYDAPSRECHWTKSYLGAHDVFTARLIETAGLETVFVGGFGTSASQLGLPDVGFLTLTEDVEAFYLVSAFYAPDRERGVRWNDPRFAISWPAEPLVISDKDRNQRDFDPAWHLEASPPSPPPHAGEG